MHFYRNIRRVINVRPLLLLIIVLLVVTFARLGTAIGFNETLDYLGTLISGEINRLKGEPAWSLALLFAWVLVGSAISLFSFYLGAMSQHWDGWDYLLYGKPISVGVDDKITVLELRELAKNCGWSKREEIFFDLNEGVSNAVADGKITLYGRQVAHASKEFWHDYPLFKIDPQHLVEYKLNFFDALWLDDNTEANTRKRVGTKSVGYVDLRVHRWEARKWIKTEGRLSRGKQSAREEQRRQRWREWWAALSREERNFFDALRPEGE